MQTRAISGGGALHAYGGYPGGVSGGPQKLTFYTLLYYHGGPHVGDFPQGYFQFFYFYPVSLSFPVYLQFVILTSFGTETDSGTLSGVRGRSACRRVQ